MPDASRPPLPQGRAGVRPVLAQGRSGARPVLAQGRAGARPVPLWAAVLAAAAGGFALPTAYPALGWWPMAFVGVALALVSLIGRRVWSAVLVGLVFGLCFFLVNVSFTGRYLGPVPWLALSIFEAVLTAVAAIPISLAYRWLPRAMPGPWAHAIGLPVLVAGVWTMREQFVGSWPYGGFPWGRVGMTQADSPLAHLASWVGISGLSFLVVALCAAVIEYARMRRLRDVRPLASAAVIAAVLLLVPSFPTTPAGTIRVGAVQGNGPAGYFDQRAPDAVLDAQLAATEPLVGKRMDVLLWPEGGVDSDPLADGATAAVLDDLAARVGAPLIVNAATAQGDDEFNTSLLWTATHGAVAQYDKRHPVPFGEYIPDRPFYHLLAPALVDLIQRGYTPGTDAPLFRVNGVGIGLAICFDVIYDDVVWEGADKGAEVYMFQTNNADFRGTSENLQQLAFARMRAIETGRAVVNLSTVGTSQVIAPDGAEIAGLKAGVAGHLLVDVPLRTGLTPAVVAGPWTSGVLSWGSLAAVAALGLTLLWRRRRGAGERHHSEDAGPEGTGVARAL